MSNWRNDPGNPMIDKSKQNILIKGIQKQIKEKSTDKITMTGDKFVMAILKTFQREPPIG